MIMASGADSRRPLNLVSARLLNSSSKACAAKRRSARDVTSVMMRITKVTTTMPVIPSVEILSA
jgi:hypothetical protein